MTRAAMIFNLVAFVMSFISFVITGSMLNFVLMLMHPWIAYYFAKQIYGSNER
jgi:hypothetical protein